MPVVPAMMKLDVAVQAFDMQDISNRRFMYNPKTGILVLGQQYGKTRGLPGSHADDLTQAGIKNGFDDFVRGWVGTGKNYPAGIIHFAPNVDAQNISLFNRAFDTLEMFQCNGALPDTVVWGFGRQWEQALSEVLSPAHNERISNQEESMEIQNITVEDLRRMEDKEGLVLQGCGGDPGEWVQGINDLLAQKGILLEGTTFTHVSVFQNEGLTCLLFPFEDVKLDIVCTHIDKHHVHNHIIVSAVNLECTKKFRNFWGSSWALRRISDKLCLEHGLSIVEDPKPSRSHYGKWLGDGNKPLSFQNQIRQAIDAALEQSPSTFEDFLKILEASGVEVTRRGKSVNFRVSGQKKPTRCNTLKGGYTEQDIRERIAGTYISSVQPKRSHSSVRMLIDIDAAMRSGSTVRNRIKNP